MGCDIHGYVEYVGFETDEGPYWECLISNLGHRDYTFFSLLADCGPRRTPANDPQPRPA